VKTALTPCQRVRLRNSQSLFFCRNLNDRHRRLFWRSALARALGRGQVRDPNQPSSVRVFLDDTVRSALQAHHRTTFRIAVRFVNVPGVPPLLAHFHCPGCHGERDSIHREPRTSPGLFRTRVRQWQTRQTPLPAGVSANSRSHGPHRKKTLSDAFSGAQSLAYRWF